MALLLPRRVVLGLPQPWDERLPDGRSVDEAVQGQSPDRMSGVASSPTPSQQPRAVALPNTSMPLPAPAQPDPYENARNPSIPPLSSLKAPPTMIERNQHGRPVAIVGGDDPVQNNMELIRAQEGYKAPRSTKDQILSFVTGGIPGGIAYATDQDTRNRWAVGGDIAKEEGQINRDLGVQSKQAGIEAQKWRPVYQQQQAGLRAGAAKEKEINDALSQYDRLETYDPDDPAQAGLRSYFESHGIQLPAKDKYHRPVPTWANGQLLLTDENGTRHATVDNQNVSDVGRTPNEKGLTPNQQASMDTRVSEGQKNRDARKANVDAIIAAATNRQDKEISSRIAAMGDPQEIYGAASDIWQQAVDKENQAKSIRIATTADVTTKKQLLDDAAKLKETVTKMQQEARKASSAGRRGASQSSPVGPTPEKPETRKGKISPQQQQLWLSHNPGKTLDDMKKLYPNAVMQ